MSVLHFLSTLRELGVKVELEDSQLIINAPKGKVTPVLLNELKEKKTKILDFLQAHAQNRVDHGNINPAENREFYPLSSPQKRLYILQQLDQQSTAYNMPAIIPLEGLPEIEKLENIFSRLLTRHESFRTTFHMYMDEIGQKIHNKDNLDVRIAYYDTSGDPDSLISSSLDFVRPFDMAVPPLWRLAVLKTEDLRSFLLIDMHHIITDGISQDILRKEFLVLYSNPDAELLPLKLQYKDFSEWQNTKDQRELMKRQENYWLRQFSGEIPVLNLPLDYERPAQQSFAGDVITSSIRSRAGVLNQLVLTTQSTVFIFLLTLLNILFSKLSGQEDIIMGTPVSGRLHADLKHIIGMFVNTLALRNFPSGSKLFKRFLSEVKENTLQAFENQEYQFEDLVDQVDARRDVSRNPLFDVMFSLKNIEPSPQKASGFEWEPYKNLDRTSKFDIEITAREEGEIILLDWRYCTKLYKMETIRRFSHYFEKIVLEIVRRPEIKISDIEIISEEERVQILYGFNNTDRKYTKEETVHSLFAQQAERLPENIALTSSDTQLTYRQLNEQTNQMARFLRSEGVNSGKKAGMMMERSIEMITGIIAVLKAGAAYIPIDPDYPEGRIASMLDNSGAAVLLTMSELLNFRPAFAGDFQGIVRLDDSQKEIARKPVEPLEHANQPEDLIYIIFTSGSTGVPKGVGISHRSFSNLMNWFINEFELHERDSNLLLTSLSFDLTQKNIYANLIVGGKLCVSGSNYFEPQSILQQIASRQVTWINCTPSMSYQIIESSAFNDMRELASLRYLFLGGESISLSMVKKWRESENCRGEIVNTYGPTECTDICASYRISRAEESLSTPVPIGKPIYNVQLYILDGYLKPLPKGIAGELFISGDGVGVGYINDIQLTSEKYIFFSPDNNKKQVLYRTGDLVKWLPEGDIEFIGRIDQQVKVRGFRIELGEIENQLLKYSKIKEVLVITSEKPDQFMDHEVMGDKTLCAYFVPRNRTAEDSTTAAYSITPMELKQYLSEELPAYMIPSHFVQLDGFPLTPNGKINRKALPMPDVSAKTEYIPPKNELEQTCVELWSEVLAIDKEKISIDADFFELGGHSLSATILIARIHKKTDVKIPLIELFKTPTIEGIAKYIKEATREEFQSIKPTEKREYYALSSPQKRLFILQQMNPDSIAYNMLEVIPLEELPELEKLERIFYKLVKRHQSLGTTFLMVKDKPVQRISEDVKIEIERCDDSLDSASATSLYSQFVQPFDLSRAPLWRAGLIKTSGAGSLLLLDLHHIISDGISQGILGREFFTLYSHLENKLMPLKLRYKDYSEWQNNSARKEWLEQQKNYWLEEFSGEIPALTLPRDYKMPREKNFEGDSVAFSIGDRETGLVERLALETESTLYVILLTLLNILLSKLSVMEDIIIGTPVSGRRHADLENIIGMFVNTLALRNYPSGDRCFLDFLKDVKRKTIEAFENQEYQFEDLVDDLKIVREAGRNPIFDVMFTLELRNDFPNGTVPHESPDTKSSISRYRYRHLTSKFDLTFIAVEGDDHINIRFEYSTKMFKKYTMERFIAYYPRIISAVLTDPSIRISDIEIISERERRQILHDFNDTMTDYPFNKTIHELFVEQALSHSHHVGIVFEERFLTYGELNSKSSQWATVLHAEGLKVNQPVAIIAHRSIELIIALIATLKSGAAYMPINREFPEERKKIIINDSHAEMVLTDNSSSEENRYGNPIKILDFGEIDVKIKDSSHNPLQSIHLPQVDADNLAYIIYTSGSTGRPKGVVVEHRNVVRLVKETNYVEFNETDKLLQTGALEFDASTFEIWGSLLNGISLCLISNEKILAAESLKQAILRYGISMIWMTAPLFNQMLQTDIEIFSGLKNLLVGGDVLSPFFINQLKKRYPELRVTNGYGPTENTTFSTTFLIDEEYGENIPIGRPIANSTAYIIDRYDHIQPVGIYGELIAGGDGVSRGYLNDPELTGERFVLHKLYSSQRIYKTGDFARWLPTGTIEFLGRVDDQVKIRGFRIELSEIEGELLKHPLVRDAAVLARDDKQADKYICAYIVPGSETGSEQAAIELRKHLTHTLPDYMVPAYFVFIKEIPLTPNGKIDRSILPEPTIELHDDFILPESKVEKKLAQLWSEILEINRDSIGINSNFFELGGHSLKATSLISNIQKEFNIKLPILEIFKSPTLRGMASLVQVIDWTSQKESNDGREIEEIKI